MIRNAACRACKGQAMARFLSLGPQPPANAFLRKEELDKPEMAFPLDVYFCSGCSLVQLCDIVSPDLLFRNYVYVSSTSPSFVAHFRGFAQEIAARFSLTPASLAVDIGSNDGILLKPFRELGVRVLGVDPADKIAAAATADGIETLPHFFTPALAESILCDKRHASVITGTNVFAHVNDLDELLGGVKILLEPEGVFIVEVPYLVDFLDKNLFDTVYHEHLSYFSVSSLHALFGRLGMRIFDVEKVGSHGGSLRVFVARKEAGRQTSQAVGRFMESERSRGLDSLPVYGEFACRVEHNRAALKGLLRDLKSSGKKIAGYGAPAKGNTLLNYFGIGPETLDYIVDDSAWKQGLYTPGVHIPVVRAEQLHSRRPDYVLILAWNFADPIMKNLAWFSGLGGKFIIPVPEARII